MRSGGCVLRLVLAVGVILPLATDSQSTGLNTEPPTAGWDEPTDAPAETQPAPDPGTTGPPDPSHPITPNTVPTELEDRAAPTVLTPTENPDTGCACDITLDFCDVGCCCDLLDCGVANLSSVFSGCEKDTRSGVCVESWLMFRANVDPQLVTVTDTLFCVRSETAVVAQTLPDLTEGPSSIFSPHFSLQDPTAYHTFNSSFYKADDIILTYYNDTAVVSALRQPSPGAASSSCMERNPAKFLRSGSLSCSRAVTPQSCRRDSSLSAHSYHTGFSLLRVPRLSKADVSNLMIPVLLLSSQSDPVQQNSSCLNVVSQVEYVMTYTSAGEITAVTLRVAQTNARFGTRLLQQHTVRFQVATPSTPPSSTPLVGLTVGTPVIGWFGEEAQPLTVQGLSVGGDCSTGLNRASILFTHNSITGCTFRSPSRDCSTLRARLYSVLRGPSTPDMVAMTAGSQPDWSRVVLQDCPDPPAGELCETGCLLPVSLSVRVIWAQRGLLALPQNHILGAKYVFSCQILKVPGAVEVCSHVHLQPDDPLLGHFTTRETFLICPLASPLPVTTEVIFSDATIYPQAPRAEPQPKWKFPFAFFSRGMEELDGE